jgi:hypothetical protein
MLCLRNRLNEELKGRIMLAFHNDPAIKELYLARVRAHREADQLIKGTYWENGKGCAVGCTVHSSSHVAYEKELGIPLILARLEDGIFETLPNQRAMLWPEEFLFAIRPGADLSLVWSRFAVWLLGDPVDGVIRFAKNQQTRKAIQDIADAYQSVVDGSSVAVDRSKLRAAAEDAWAAEDAAGAAGAAWAAGAAEAAEAAWAARAAARAAWAARAAAWAAGDAAWAAGDAAYIKQADTLLKLLAAA